jgi:hypothetical protein
MNLYEAITDSNGCIVGAVLMPQWKFDELGLEGFTVERERGITCIRPIEKEGN